jgi:hypothetical protein
MELILETAAFKAEENGENLVTTGEDILSERE